MKDRDDDDGGSLAELWQDAKRAWSSLPPEVRASVAVAGGTLAARVAARMFAPSHEEAPTRTARARSVTSAPTPAEVRARARVEAAKVLGIDPTATPAEVKRAYRERSRKAHPDAGGSASEFRKVRHAFDTLSRRAVEV